MQSFQQKTRHESPATRVECPKQGNSRRTRGIAALVTGRQIPSQGWRFEDGKLATDGQGIQSSRASTLGFTEAEHCNHETQKSPRRTDTIAAPDASEHLFVNSHGNGQGTFSEGHLFFRGFSMGRESSKTPCPLHFWQEGGACYFPGPWASQAKRSRLGHAQPAVQDSFWLPS